MPSVNSFSLRHLFFLLPLLLIFNNTESHQYCSVDGSCPADSDSASFPPEIQLLEPPLVIESVRTLLEDESRQFGGKVIRIKLPGLSRLTLPFKLFYSASIHLTVEAPSHANRFVSHGKSELCTHWNESLPLGYCPLDGWKVITPAVHGEDDKRGLKLSASLYVNTILDIRIIPLAKTTSGEVQGISITYEEKFESHRPILLLLGVLAYFSAPYVSEFVPFYYTTGMSVGVILVTIVLLFQIMRLLPFGQKKSWYLMLCGTMVGAGAFLVNYLSNSARMLLVSMGLGEDLFFPAMVALAVTMFVIGAALGFWIVRKFILAQDGSIDRPIALFVKWTIRFISSVLLLMSSRDVILGLAVWAATASLSLLGWVPYGYIWRILFRRPKKKTPLRKKSGRASRSSIPESPNTPGQEPPCRAEFSTPTEEVPARAGNEFPSSFHKTPQKRMTVGEADEIGKVYTKEAIEQLVKTPQFVAWALNNLDRMTVESTETRVGRTVQEVEETAGSAGDEDCSSGDDAMSHDYKSD